MIVKGTEAIRSRLPAGMNVENFMSAVVMEANKLPPNVAPRSVADSAMNCAILGLIPGSALGHAYFVAYGKDNPVCQLIVGYRGFLELAYNSRFLKSVYAEVVLAGEDFRQYATISGPQIEHEIPLDRAMIQENVVASYCVWEARGGGRGLSVVPKSELLRIPQRNVWLSEFSEMSKKTAIRLSSKVWKLSQTLAMAVELDEQAERGDPQRRIVDFDGFDDRPVPDRLPGESKSDHLANVLETRTQAPETAQAASPPVGDSTAGKPAEGTAEAKKRGRPAATKAPAATAAPADPKPTTHPAHSAIDAGTATQPSPPAQTTSPAAPVQAPTQAAAPEPEWRSTATEMYEETIKGIEGPKDSEVVDDVRNQIKWGAQHKLLTEIQAKNLSAMLEGKWALVGPKPGQTA